mgnify:CR=1 FL=1
MSKPNSWPDSVPRCLVTPDARFQGIDDFPYACQTIDVGGVRLAWWEAGKRAAPPIILLHGEPTWSYLYRDMIAPLAAAGYRVLAPDLIGFGRSDKPSAIHDHSYAAHVAWVGQWFDALGLDNAVLFGQDWGALIGLRVLAERPDRLTRVFIANGFLPTGDEKSPLIFKLWRGFARFSPGMPIGGILQAGTRRWLTRRERAVFAAPFPDRRYMAGVRALPRLVPIAPNDPASQANRDAWSILKTFHNPFHICFSDSDPVTRGLDDTFRHIPGARHANHTTIHRAGHFLQLDAGARIAQFMLEQMDNPPPRADATPQFAPSGEQ